jgi:hypothetical protein
MSIRHLFDTAGESVAFIAGTDLFSRDCDWLGVVAGAEVYNVEGQFVGWIDEADRLVRTRAVELGKEICRPRRPMTPVRPIPPKRRLVAPNVPPSRQDVFGSLRRTPTALPTFARIMEIGRLEGCRIVGDDGAFLGLISRSREAESIADAGGPYGDPTAALSIFNDRGRYGSRPGPLSAFDPDAPSPPRLIRSDEFLAHLSTNPDLPERVDPNAVLAWLAG